jgi:hypothetical protein
MRNKFPIINWWGIGKILKKGKMGNLFIIFLGNDGIKLVNAFDIWPILPMGRSAAHKKAVQAPGSLFCEAFAAHGNAGTGGQKNVRPKGWLAPSENGGETHAKAQIAKRMPQPSTALWPNENALCQRGDKYMEEEVLSLAYSTALFPLFSPQFASIFHIYYYCCQPATSLFYASIPSHFAAFIFFLRPMNCILVTENGKKWMGECGRNGREIRTNQQPTTWPLGGNSGGRMWEVNDGWGQREGGGALNAFLASRFGPHVLWPAIHCFPSAPSEIIFPHQQCFWIWSWPVAALWRKKAAMAGKGARQPKMQLRPSMKDDGTKCMWC